MSRNPLHTALLVAACLSVVALVGWRAGAESTASTHAAAQPTTIALVSVDRALNPAVLQELADLNEGLAARAADRQKQIDELGHQVEDIAARLDTLPESEVTQRRDLVVQRVELEEMRKARFAIYQRLIQVEQGEVIQPLYEKFLKAVEEVATKQGYDLVLFDDRTMKVAPSSGADVNTAIERKRILYAAPNLDITDQVVLLMNQKYQASVE